MSVNSLHPEITTERIAEWRLLRDAMAGESAIKKRGEVYLPKPSGFKSQPDDGEAAYEAYRKRADFPEILAPSIAAMVGIVHAKETQIEMPEAMAWLWEDADGHGLSLEAFHRRITRNLLWLGRYGVLADAPRDGGEPFLVGFAAEAVINWDIDFFVLDESDFERTGFTWDFVNHYRVLRLDNGFYVQEIYKEGAQTDASEALEPTTRGGRRLERVPFQIGNARDLKSDIETPPLIGVANAARAIYQLSADYRHQLFMSGQETLVALNGDPPEYVGAGVVHAMSGGDGGFPPDLKYVSPTCAGIKEHREAMREHREAAVMAGARMFETNRSQESGEARRLRFASETANLMSVALTSAGLLERSLRDIAMMIGANESEVVVNPPADLLDTTMNPTEAQALMAIWQSGGISYQTFYENLQRGGIASPERDHEAEDQLIDGQTFRDNQGVTAL